MVPFNLCAMLGYEYVLQIDGDSFVLEPYPHNLLRTMRAGNFTMGGKQ
jgi:hypothetical protein